MTVSKQGDLVREIESALSRSPKKSESGRYAVYVPGEVVLGTFDKKKQAREVASKWTKIVPEVVVVDRSTERSPD